MAAHLRQPPLSIDMDTIVQTALRRGYTAQGEMFSGNKRYELFGVRHYKVHSFEMCMKFVGSESFLIAWGISQFVSKAE